ncbi:MAG: hypothetical protein ACREFF_14545 [Candidatus Udaeobacter sp.]
MSERIDKLREAVETMHECKARHVGSDPVIELFRGEVAWDGVVETFNLEGHPKAKRCYAWSFVENGEPQYTTVLEIPPVDSPQSAVKVAIASKARSNNAIYEGTD